MSDFIELNDYVGILYVRPELISSIRSDVESPGSFILVDGNSLFVMESPQGIIAKIEEWKITRTVYEKIEDDKNVRD